MLKEYPTAGGAPLKECNRDAVSEPNLAVAKVKPAGDEAQSEPNIPFRVAQAPAEMSESKYFSMISCGLFWVGSTVVLSLGKVYMAVNSQILACLQLRGGYLRAIKSKEGTTLNCIY